MSSLGMRKTTAPFAFSQITGENVYRTLHLEMRKDARSARRTILAVVLTIAAALVWASLTPIHETVTASGEIVTAEALQEVQHLEGGIVDSIQFSIGDTVSSGDVLLLLRNEEAFSDLAEVDARLHMLDEKIPRLHSILAGEAHDPGAAEGLTRISSSQHRAWLLQTEHLAARIDLLKAERATSRSELAPLRASHQLLLAEAAIIDDQLALSERLLANGLVARQRVEESRRESLRIRQETEQIAGRLLRIEAEMGLSRAREVETIADLKSKTADEIARLEGERGELRARREQLADRLNRLEIIAPMAGTIQQIMVSGKGSVVRPGDTVVQLVPDGTPAEARVEVPANSIGMVRPNMTARIRVLTFDPTLFGELDAEVSHISPSSLENKEGEQYFEVKLRLAQHHLGEGPKRRNLGPGMSIQADFVGDRRSILHYVVKPLRILADRPS